MIFIAKFFADYDLINSLPTKNFLSIMLIQFLQKC